MLRELQGAKTTQDRPADVGKPAIDQRGHARTRTARQWYGAAAVLIAAASVAVIAWLARVAEMSEGSVTTPGASAVDHGPLGVTATP
jgi:hypothetical protein